MKRLFLASSPPTQKWSVGVRARNQWLGVGTIQRGRAGHGRVGKSGRGERVDLDLVDGGGIRSGNDHCPVGFAVLRPILTTLRCAMIGVAVLAQVPVHRGKIPALRASNTGVGRLKQKTFFEFSSTGDRRSAPGWMGHWCFWAGAAVARLPERYMWVGASGILRPATWSTSLEEEEGRAKIDSFR